MKDFIELTTSTEETSWIPVDSYADLILEAVVCYGQLHGVITAINHDFQACQGKIIQVRTIAERAGQSIGDNASSVANCLSATSSTLTTYSITLGVYGDYDQLTEFGLFQTCGNLKAAILKEMGKGISKKMDQDILTAMLTGHGAPSVSQSLTSALYCFKGFPDWQTRPSGHASAIWGNACDLYDKVIHSVGSMRNFGYNPDYLILNPNVAAFLKINYDNHMLDALIDYDKESGVLTRLGGLKVIECCNFPACVDTSGATMAMVIDSSRAVGEAYGKHPQYTEDYVAECLYYKEVVSLFWGTHSLDPRATCHITNP